MRRIGFSPDGFGWPITAVAIVGLALSSARMFADETPTTVEQETRTVRFQNGMNDYGGTLNIGIDTPPPNTTVTSKVLWVDRVKDGVGQQVLVQFRDIIGNGPRQVPPGAEITKAVLRIYVGRETSRHRIYFHRMLIPWKADATWNSPAWGGNGVRVDDRDALAEADGNNIFFRQNQHYEVDVTAALRAWVGGQPNYGWVLQNIRRQSDPYGFCSSTAAVREQRPELIVTYAADSTNKAPRIGTLAAAVTKSRSTGAISASLSLQATDTDNDALNVIFYGRKQAEAAPDYSIILLPDTQYYTRQRFGGTENMLASQIDWIVNRARAQNIACVFQLGDISDQGDTDETEWQRAIACFYKLEDPAATGLPHGVPYCMAVGNHDQKFAGGDNGATKYYNKYFGMSHFAGKSYYGGHYGNNNNNYFVLFNAGGEKGLVFSFEFGRPRKDPEVLRWAEHVAAKFPDRRIFVITHFSMEPGLQSPPGPDGEAIYEAFKHNPNFVLIVGGHITGEGRRADVYKGKTAYTLVQDFQFDENGGSGFLGIMTLSPRQNRIFVKTYSPFLNKWRTDDASDYTLDYDFGAQPGKFTELGRMSIKSGESTRCSWGNLELGAGYEWYAEVSDGKKTARTETRAFQLKLATAKGDPAK